MRPKPTRAGDLPWWGILFPLLTTVALGMGFTLGVRSARPPRDLQLFEGIRSRVGADYVEPRTSSELLYTSLEGMLESLDRHCRFYRPVEARQEQERNQGKYEGIGVVFHPANPPDRPLPTILFPMAGSPGERAGLLPGDTILAVGDRELAGATDIQVPSLIKGPAGTRVRLKVKRLDGTTRTFEVERAGVLTRSVGKPDVLDRERGIAYLAVREFQAHTVEDFDAAWKRLAARGARSLVLDLRENGGGNLTQASLLINRFIDAAGADLVGQVGRGRQAVKPYRARREEAHLADIPLVVLVNGHSASASEVVAAAIQDWCRGVILGSRSYGKGTVQTLVTMPAPEAETDGPPRFTKFKFTSARYYTSSGLLVEPPTAERKAGAKGGVVPDLPVAMGRAARIQLGAWLDSFDVPERYREAVAGVRRELGLPTPEAPADPQLEAALALLRGTPPLLATTYTEKRQ